MTCSRRLLLVLLSSLGACTAAPAPEMTPPVAAEEPAAPPTAAEKAETAAPADRGLRLRGVDASTVVEGIGQRIAVGRAPLVVDLEDGTRVTAAPGAQLWACALAKTLLLVSGELQASRIVDAQQAAVAPVRIATLAGAIEANPGAELALRVEQKAKPSSYRAQLRLTRGSATWSVAGKETQLIAGEPLPEPAPGLHWLSAPAEPRTRDKQFSALKPVALTSDVDHALDVALSDQQALRQHGQALLAQLRMRHTTTDSPRAEQRELVAHAQRREAQHSRLLSAAERSLLQAVVSCGETDPSTCAALQAWSDRFSARASELL